ncbi:co-chaperone GroES [Granulicatella seriolae]|uniref:Co-chaperonin GroES n=1 Tax=Granulicatella seriolae TaxID=2967226 RepID=A0ABT1WMA9_9LACT|nr:co-chaperone GroES [Granulicatella seriolae]
MLKPLKDRVVIKMVEPEEKTLGGLVLPSAAQEKSQIGQVVAVSDFTDEDDRQVQEGDRVVFEKYSGTEIKFEGQEYIVVKEKDLIAIVK